MMQGFHPQLFGHSAGNGRAGTSTHPVVDLLGLQTLVLRKGSHSAVTLAKRRLHILPMKNLAHACL